jgi:4'-phosphopantetheinyl transferase
MNQMIESVPFIKLEAPDIIISLLSPQQANQIRELYQNYGLVVVYTQLHQEEQKSVLDEQKLIILGNDKKQYDAAKNPAYKYRYLLGRALIKRTLSACLEISVDEIQLQYGNYGKPFITGVSQAIDFNLSHTQDILVLAVTKLGQIGIDIEPSNRSLESLEIAETICTDFELQEVNSLAQDLRNPFLLQLWTLKEAFSKSLGLGLHKDFSSFGFQKEASCFHLVDLESTTNYANNLSFFSSIFLGNYRLSLALGYQ